jgi:hypothetical protein
MTQTGTKKKPGKLLGDAGEHYALSQFSFAGKYAAKMPDNWEAYDLAVETGNGLTRVSVKTRSESTGWSKSRWFNFDDQKDCDWIVFIFKTVNGSLRSWVIPYDLAKEHANVPGANRKNAWFRDLSWGKLNRDPLAAYENNWSLQDFRNRMELYFEGGSVSTEEQDGKFLLHINQVALLDLLDPDEREGLSGVTTYSFSTLAERNEYMRKRGWSNAD